MSDRDSYGTTDTLRAADLEDLASVLTSQRARARDVVASADRIASVDGRLTVASTEVTLTDDGVMQSAGRYNLTRLAESQLAAKLQIPGNYLTRSRASSLPFYDDTVNHWMHEDPSKKFLLRILRATTNDGVSDGAVRAFLTNGFRVIDNLDVLLATLAGIRSSGVHVDIDGADLTERRMVVRVSAPEVAVMARGLLANYRNPFADGGAVRVGNGGWTLESAQAAAAAEGLGYAPGEAPILFAGFEISNSEVGQGQFTIVPRIKVQICKNGLTMTADAMNTRHVGARLEEGVVEWSDETQQRNLELISAKTTDAVRTFLSTSYVERKVAELEKDAGAKVSDPKGTIEVVGQSLGFSEAVQSDILSHFILGGQLTSGGIMQAVTSVAQTLEDGDAARELEMAAVPALKLAAAAGR